MRRFFVFLLFKHGLSRHGVPLPRSVRSLPLNPFHGIYILLGCKGNPPLTPPKEGNCWRYNGLFFGQKWMIKNPKEFPSLEGLGVGSCRDE